MIIYYFLFSALIFVFGITVGSFLNVCIYRIPRGESISFPPSHCTVCKNKIKWYHLIPILSYVFLKGRCAYCGSKISIRYPFIETINGIGWVLIFLILDMDIRAVLLMIIFSILLVVIMIIYDRFLGQKVKSHG
jgi:leader peptidase (prepilin peptidase)/N-methyltransferase